MAGETDEKRRRAATQRAITLVLEAIDLLDGYGGPPEAAANLEVALQAMRAANRESSS